MQNNLFFEMLPLVAFFGVYYFTKNIYLATAICIVASWLQLLLCKFKYNHISKNTWISTVLITVFGGLTIILHNKTFVMLKPTLLFWIMGVSLLIGQIAGKNGIKLMLGKEIHLPNSFWAKLNLAWALFFITMGGINLFIAFNYPEDIWVKFKVFGSLGLSIIFTAITAIAVFITQKKQAQ
ncbi:MAG: intracellular septation protein [Pseudomonadota bacterium]|nr:intracellular septation protein [Pseudomonadota bacterium]